jgi:hypothetical protein
MGRKPLFYGVPMRRVLFICLAVLLAAGWRPPSGPVNGAPRHELLRPLRLGSDTERVAFQSEQLIDHGDNSHTRICRLAHKVGFGGTEGGTVDGFQVDQVFDADGNLFTNDKTILFKNYDENKEATRSFQVHNDNDFNDNGYIWYFTDPETPGVWMEESNDFERGFLVYVQ